MHLLFLLLSLLLVGLAAADWCLGLCVLAKPLGRLQFRHVAALVDEYGAILPFFCGPFLFAVAGIAVAFLAGLLIPLFGLLMLLALNALWVWFIVGTRKALHD